MRIGDRVRDRDYYYEGRIVGIYGRWAWIIVDGDPPGTNPVTSQIVSLDLLDHEAAEAA